MFHSTAFQRIFTFTCMLAMTLSSCGSKKEEKTEKDKKDGPVIVDVMIASPQAISSTIEANGTVVANETVQLRSEVPGRLTYVNVPEGSRVAKGTVIARINDADLRAQLGKLQTQLQLARTTEQRYKKLIEIGGINMADYDLAVNQSNSLQADINVLQADIAKTIIRAPFSGVVGLRQASPGAYVTSNDVLATFHNTDKLKVDFTLPEEYASVVKKGDAIAVDIDGGNGQRKRAIVLAVEPQAITATRNLQVRALLDGGNVNPGAFAKVFINAGSDKNSVMVPASAIIPEDRDKTLVVVKAGKAKYVTVETGIRQSSNVEILSGIQPGDTIVVSGVLFARPNSPVKIRAIKKLEDITP